jgi:hypothetical protein
MFPTFVPVEEIASEDVRFEWSDWDPYSAVGSPPRERVKELSAISNRALVAYATACAEWVVYRFVAVSDDATPSFFLEALWVSGVDSSYPPPPESDERQWKGPVRGSIDLTLMTVLNAIGSSVDGGEPEVDAGLAEQIALHVLPRGERFLAWRDACFARLATHFSRVNDTGQTLGLPPQVFGRDFDYAMLGGYAADFLETVDIAQNPFLGAQRSSPQRLR